VRGFHLARVAAKAELLRLKSLLRRQAMRIVLAIVAGVFLVSMLAWLHVAAAIALTGWVKPVWSVLIVAAADAVIAIILLVLAARNAPGRVEREALQVRRDAVHNAIETVMLASLVARLGRVRSFRDLLALVITAGGTVFATRHRR
jgi:membrane protein implicated in regulation of membrane protease activity